MFAKRPRHGEKPGLLAEPRLLAGPIRNHNERTAAEDSARPMTFLDALQRVCRADGIEHEPITENGVVVAVFVRHNERVVVFKEKQASLPTPTTNGEAAAGDGVGSSEQARLGTRRGARYLAGLPLLPSEPGQRSEGSNRP